MGLDYSSCFKYDIIRKSTYIPLKVGCAHCSHLGSVGSDKNFSIINSMAEETTYEGYCVKCKEKRQMKDAKVVPMKGKGGVERRAAKGTCPDCGTTMFRILGKEA